MPKTVVDSRHVDLRAVHAGEEITLPARTGMGYVRERAPSKGVYFQVHESGFFVPADELWNVLDKLIDDA